MMTDPIADMLTRIRNANRIYKKEVSIPHSKIKENIASKMKQTGFIQDYKVEDHPVQKVLTVYLKYGEDGETIIRRLDRVSKPGRRVYKKVTEFSQILGGMGIEIVSTSKGIMTDHECRQQKIGGEILCTVW